MATEKEVELFVWVKPDGSEIKINDAPATIAKAIELGWTNDEFNPLSIDEKPIEEMSATELKAKFAEIGEEYPGNKDSAIARLKEIAGDSE